MLSYAAGQGLTERLDPAAPILAGEIGYAVATAGAVRLADAVLRRTPFGAAGRPARPALARAAAIMGARLGWTPERLEQEIVLVDERYHVPSSTAP